MATNPPPSPHHAFHLILPPSLGPDRIAKHAQALEAFLLKRLGKPVEVTVARSYDQLAKDVLAGRADAAWAPPFICARLEAMGVRMLVQGVRRGAVSYRAALLCRRDRALTLEELSGLKALWVDRDAVAGYLLPLAFLRSRGIDPAKAFVTQDFAGSY